MRLTRTIKQAIRDVQAVADTSWLPQTIYPVDDADYGRYYVSVESTRDTRVYPVLVASQAKVREPIITILPKTWYQ